MSASMTRRRRRPAGGRTDLMIETAGVMLGARPRNKLDPRHIKLTYGARFLLELACVPEDAPAVRRWVPVGEERRTRGRGPEPDRGW
jgi:hypothetical protein